MEYLKEVLLILVGGLIGAISNFYLGVKKSKTDDFVVLRTAYREEFDRLMARVNELEAQVELYKEYAEKFQRIIEKHPHLGEV